MIFKRGRGAWLWIVLPSILWAQSSTQTVTTPPLPGFEATPVSTATSSRPLDSFLLESLTIRSIHLQGLRNTKESLIRSQIKTRISEPFDPLEAKSDLKRLMGLGIFASADVAVSTQLVSDKFYLDVTFVLEENPKIHKVNIMGNKLLGKGAIKDILSPSQSSEDQKKQAYGEDVPRGGGREFKSDIAVGSYLDEGKLFQTLQQIRSKYEEKAIFDTKVSADKKLIPETNQVDIAIRIEEGKKGRIALIGLEGFESFPRHKIARLIKIKRGKAFSLKKIQKGLGKLDHFYKESGWLDFEVQMTSRTLTLTEMASLKFKVKETEVPVALRYVAKEGNRHYLLSYHFEGAEIISQAELTRLASLQTDKVLQESRLREAQGNILEAYRNKGRLFASIELVKNWKQSPDGLDLILKIAERQKVYIGSVYIEGLVKTKEHVIRREILLKEGDLFQSKKLYRSQEKIFNLGFIEDIQPDYEATPNPNYVDLIFDIKEGRPGMLTAGAGFSSVDGVVGQVSIQHTNIFGRAQRIGLSTEFGQRRQSYDLTWTTPWTFDKPMSTTFGLFNTGRSLQFATNATGFKRRSRGGSVFMAPRLQEDTWILGLGYTFQEDRIFDVLDIYKDQIPETVTNRSSLEGRITYDTRDYYLDPKKGTEQSMSAVLAGGPVGGNVDFVKPTFKHAIHVPTFTLGARHTFVLSSSLRWGVVEEYGKSKDILVSDRFFVGGAETVRGYTYTGQIGPIAGGKAYTVGNIEYKMPLLMEGRLTIIQGAVFVDFGGAWRGARSVNLNFGRHENNLKAGIGFGIRFKTPAFPIRLDWGWGLHHNPGEAISQFYFTIGSIL